MNISRRVKHLRIALIIIGILFTFGLYPLMVLWPSGFSWTPPQPEYEQMIVGIYVTLGVFLFVAAFKPLKHLSVIWFAAWSSIVHATIMLVQALSDKTDYGNLLGDIPTLYIIGIVLLILTPRKSQLKH